MNDQCGFRKYPHLPGPMDDFLVDFTVTVWLFVQFDALKQYIEKGGSLLVLLGEGGESRFDTNINFLLEDYGIMVNNGQYYVHCKPFLIKLIMPNY